MAGKYDVPPINILECLPFIPMPPIPTAQNLLSSTSGALDLASAPGRSTAPSSEPAALVTTIQFISQSSVSAWSVKYTVHNPSHSWIFVVASATSAVRTLPTHYLQCAWLHAVDLVPRLAVSTSPRCCKTYNIQPFKFCTMAEMRLKFKILNNVVAPLR